MKDNTGRMMKKIAAAVMTAACAAHIAFAQDPAGVDVFPPRVLSEAAFDVSSVNPAFLGVDGVRGNGFSLVPTSVYLWSDKLAVKTVISPNIFGDLTDMERLSRRISFLINESFGLRGLSPEEVSQKMTEDVRGGVTVFAGLRTMPISFASNGLALSVKTIADLELRLPESALLPIFSNTGGVVAKNRLDFSDFYFDLLVASEVALRGGWHIPVPVFLELAGFEKGAVGVGAKYMLGHSYLQVTAEPNSRFEYNEDANAYTADFTFNVMTAGTGFRGNWAWSLNNLFGEGLPVVGWGPGFDVGAVFYNSNNIISFGLQDMGIMVWSGKARREVDYVIRKDTFDIVDLIENPNHVFDREKGEYFPNAEDTLAPAVGKMLLTYMPMSMNVGYTYTYRLPNLWSRILCDYVSASVLYHQQNIRRSGRFEDNSKYTLGGGAGLLYGFVPVRYGMTFGGLEGVSSVLGAGLDFKYVTVDAAYRAIGSAGLVPHNGFEVGGALSWRWTGKKKTVGGKPSARPAPRPAPEIAVPADTAVVADTAASVVDTAAVVAADTAATDAIPADTVTTDTVKTEIVPTEVAPIVPTEGAPAEVVPTDTTAPIDTVPAEVAPTDAVPTESVPTETAPVVPVAPVPTETVPVVPVAPVPTETAPVVPVAPVPTETAPVVPIAPVPEAAAPTAPVEQIPPSIHGVPVPYTPPPETVPPTYIPTTPPPETAPVVPVETAPPSSITPAPTAE